MAWLGMGLLKVRAGVGTREADFCLTLLPLIATYRKGGWVTDRALGE